MSVCLLTIVLNASLVWSVNAAERWVFHHEHVLGTSLEIQVHADSEAVAAAAEQRVLDEVQRLSLIFSSYDSKSEFCRWHASSEKPVKVSNELFELLEECDRWHRISQGAFNPAVQELTQLWQAAEQQNQLPADEMIHEVVKRIQPRPWTLDSAEHLATRLTGSRLSLDAIAKGVIVEKACAAGYNESSEVHGILVNIGGDLRVRGDIVQLVNIVDPKRDSENDAPVSAIFISDRGLATSGNYRRGFDIGEMRFSHIIDPRTGLPVSQIVSATVVANSTGEADVLATIFSVLPPEETARLTRRLNGVDYLLIDNHGQHHMSEHWPELEQPQLFRRSKALTGQFALAPEVVGPDDEEDSDAAKKAPSDSQLLELTVKFELNPAAGGQYRRPYVAVWLEDADEFPVRTSILWMQTKQPGPRWHRDLLRWYRNDGVRKLADGKELIGTISGATRGPGEYKAVFDGKDDTGNLLPPGKYTLFIEVAREHGTYQLIRHSMTLGKDPIAETKLKSNAEVKSASLEYRARGSVKPAHAK